jgi:hypothetical protein
MTSDAHGGDNARMLCRVIWLTGINTFEDPNSYIQGRKQFYTEYLGARGGAVVEALRYKPEGRGIDSRWCYWNFSLT